LSDYSGSLQRAKAFDSKIQSDASAVSLDYAGLVSLSVRQAFGAIEITVSSNGNSYNTDDVLVFMKGSLFLHLEAVQLRLILDQKYLVTA
jgi:hypothetical protein